MEVKRALRLLHLPNEATLERYNLQYGSRMAFQGLLERGKLSAYEVFTFLWEYQQVGSAETTLKKLVALAHDFQPDIIFWQHLSGFPVTREALTELKSLQTKPILVYHEADAYGRWIKRFDQSIRTIMPFTDLVVRSGMGAFFDLTHASGAKRVIYCPQPFDTARFGTSWIPTHQRPFDVVMIGNYVRPRIPGREFPGSRKRRALAKALCKRFGSRFALYGNGWDGIPCAKGPLPFNQQEEAIRSAWLSINWDHFDDVPYYFSDRLPISLAAGVPHVTGYHPGYEHLFGACEGLFLARSPADAVDSASYLLSLPPKRLVELGKSAQAFAYAHLEATKVYTDLFEVIVSNFFDVPSGSGDRDDLQLASPGAENLRGITSE